jgi:hypothetical protein
LLQYNAFCLLASATVRDGFLPSWGTKCGTVGQLELLALWEPFGPLW